MKLENGRNILIPLLNYIDEETETLTIGKDDYKILKLSSKELKLDDLSFKDYMEEGDWMHLTYRKVSNGDLREEEFTV